MERSILALLILILASTISGSFSSSGGTGDGGGSSSSRGDTGDGSGVIISGSINRRQGACAACAHRRKRCTPKCIFAPYFPADQPRTFQNANKLFGLYNIMNILKTVPREQLDDAMASIKYESDTWVRFPSQGCVGAISLLREQIESTISQIIYLNSQLKMVRNQHQTTNNGGMYSGNVGLTIQPNVSQPPDPSVLYNNNSLMQMPQMESLNLNHGRSFTNDYYGNYQDWWQPLWGGYESMNSVRMEQPVLVNYENEGLERIAGGSSSNQHQTTNDDGMYNGNDVGLTIQPNVGQPPDPSVLYNNNYLMPLPQMESLNLNHGRSFTNDYYGNYQDSWQPLWGGYESMNSVRMEQPVLVNYENEGLERIAGGSSSNQHQTTNDDGMYSGNDVGLTIQANVGQPHVGQPPDPSILYNNNYLMPLPQIESLNLNHCGSFNIGYYNNYQDSRQLLLGGYESIETVGSEHPVLVNDDNRGFDGIAGRSCCCSSSNNLSHLSKDMNISYQEISQPHEDQADINSLPLDWGDMFLEPNLAEDRQSEDDFS